MENAFVYELLFVIKYPVSLEKVTTSKNWGPVNPYPSANALQVLFKGVHFETFIASISCYSSFLSWFISFTIFYNVIFPELYFCTWVLTKGMRNELKWPKMI